jgi:hypothetical protein
MQEMKLLGNLVKSALIRICKVMTKIVIKILILSSLVSQARMREIRMVQILTRKANHSKTTVVMISEIKSILSQLIKNSVHK